LSASFAAAQSETPNTLVINPQIGINAATLSGETDNIQHDANVGWQIGGYLRYGKRFYIQPGIFWHYMNTETTDASSVEDFKFEQQISTIQVPVCVGFNIIDDDNAADLDKDDINSTQWLGRIGAGLDFTMFTVDLGYDYGFSKFYTDELIAEVALGGIDASDTKIQEFFLNFGLRF
jgi:hypothetical protein